MDFTYLGKTICSGGNLIALTAVRYFTPLDTRYPITSLVYHQYHKAFVKWALFCNVQRNTLSISETNADLSINV